jgi:hypothetical protein
MAIKYTCKPWQPCYRMVILDGCVSDLKSTLKVKHRINAVSPEIAQERKDMDEIAF